MTYSIDVGADAPLPVVPIGWDTARPGDLATFGHTTAYVEHARRFVCWSTYTLVRLTGDRTGTVEDYSEHGNGLVHYWRVAV